MSLLNFLTFGLLGKTPQHDHTCHCGTARVSPHQTGTQGCERFMTIPPEDMGGDRWRVDGHEITGYSLREQRGYHQHSCGCWSRHEGSDNSISA
jgi:hypothetical protein